MSFEQYSQTTREIDQTLNPLWDHTCVFDDIKMFGSPSDVKGSPPKIMIEIFDKDNVVSIMNGCYYSTFLALHYMYPCRDRNCRAKIIIIGHLLKILSLRVKAIDYWMGHFVI